MDLLAIALAPVRIPQRAVRALDDLATLAERARRDPDPVEEARDLLREAIGEIRTLNRNAEGLRAEIPVVLAVARSLIRVAQSVDVTGRDIVAGGEELTAVGKALDADGRELVDGGEDLVEVSRELAGQLQILRAALPRILDGLDSVEHLEGAVETVADTVEPLQGAAERVGRVTRRLSRSPS